MVTLTFEKIENNHGGHMARARVPGGWLVHESNDVAHIGNDKNEYVTTGYDWRTSMVFIPDPNGDWK